MLDVSKIVSLIEHFNYSFFLCSLFSANMFVYSTILGIVVFFIVVTSAYIALINWQDVNALIYSGKWLIKQEEVKFATGL